jgi:hypothetical protein
MMAEWAIAAFDGFATCWCLAEVGHAGHGVRQLCSEPGGARSLYILSMLSNNSSSSRVLERLGMHLPCGSHCLAVSNCLQLFTCQLPVAVHGLFPANASVL